MSAQGVRFALALAGGCMVTAGGLGMVLAVVKGPRPSRVIVISLTKPEPGESAEPWGQAWAKANGVPVGEGPS